jgi:ATP-dependent protease ClpP protease subunit
MMKLLFLLIFLMTLTLSAKKSPSNIVLNGDNFFAVTDVFDELLLEEFSKKVMTYKGKSLYIYFDSPGGSVFAMSRIIGVMKSSDIKFTCIARFAASAAFAMYQACDTRYLLYDGILMQHNASVGLQGELPRIRTQLDAIEAVITAIEIDTANRLKMSYKNYKVAINNNMWLSQEKAIKRHAADTLLESISCSKKLVESVVVKPVSVCSFFFCDVSYQKFSGCPLLLTPIPELSKDKKDDGKAREVLDLLKPINTTIKNIMWIMPDLLETPSI